MKNGMKRIVAALALCIVAVCAYADDKYSALIKAVKNNNASEVVRLIKSRAKVNAKGYSKTALMVAAENNAVDAAKVLIEARADVNAKDNGGGATALMFAANYNATDVAKVLIEAKADVNAKNKNGNTALMYVAMKNAIDVAKLLIEAGADVNARDYYGDTALMFAAESNAIDVAKLLIEAGADVNARERDGDAALMFALESKAINVAKLLIEAGADMNAKEKRLYDTLIATINNSAEIERCRVVVFFDPYELENNEVIWVNKGDTVSAETVRKIREKVDALLDAKNKYTEWVESRHDLAYTSGRMRFAGFAQQGKAVIRGDGNGWDILEPFDWNAPIEKDVNVMAYIVVEGRTSYF